MNTLSSALPGLLHRRTLLAGLAALAAGLQGCAASSTTPTPSQQPAPAGGLDLSRYALNRPVGPTVAETGSPHYRFDSFKLASADGKRRYHVQLAVPLAAPPQAGYPLLYLLDGNAAFAALTAEELEAMARSGKPLAIAAIGYDTPLGVDVEARSYDYTPPVPGERITFDDESRGRLGGGADLFLDLLAQRIRPDVEKRVPADPMRTTLWGHSYGGLLVLHTLFTRPHMFPRYASADASLWWHDGFLLSEEARAVPLPAQRTTQLLLMAGSAAQEVASNVQRPLRPGIDPAVAANALARRRVLPPDAAERQAERLQKRAGLAVDWRMFPGVSHGPMRPASIPPTLLFAAQ
ncbi:MAG: alpha/beta hydrolase [Variovorax sp.]|nr:MAG: alpha/beta hydrolase [Variovorax sp.]